MKKSSLAAVLLTFSSITFAVSDTGERQITSFGIQTGGPSGGCIPEKYLDMPVDYDSLSELGSIMGSGGMIVIDETSSMVDVAKVADLVGCQCLSLFYY